MAKWSIPDPSKIPTNLLDPSLLERVYIPNLVTSPSTISKAYTELIGMHLSGSRNLHGFSLLNCYRTSLHPQCAGSKPRTCSSSNTSLGTSFLLVHSQHSLAWLSYTLTAKYETKDDSTCHVHRIFCASKGQNEIYYQFEDKQEATSEPDAPVEATNPVPAPVAAAPVVIAAPPLLQLLALVAAIDNVNNVFFS